MAVTDDVGDMLLWPTYYSYLKMGCTKDDIHDDYGSNESLAGTATEHYSANCRERIIALH